MDKSYEYHFDMIYTHLCVLLTDPDKLGMHEFHIIFYIVHIRFRLQSQGLRVFEIELCLG